MKSLTLLLKPASSLCNMRCKYCFYEDESNIRSQKSMGIMSEETMQLLIAKAMEYVGQQGKLNIAFQGGEPTLAGAAYFRNFTESAERQKSPGIQIHYSIQTNGLELSDELLEVLKKWHFLVGISLDGFRLLHDSNRIDAAGNGTWNRILKNLKRLQAAGIEVNALCVITAQAAKHPEKIYRTLKQLGFSYLQYIPCLDPLQMPRGTMPFSLSPEDYGIFLRESFRLWYADWKRGAYTSIRIFEDMVYNAMGLPCSNCAQSGQCGHYLVIEADGSAYPCDFYALDSWKLGTIGTASVQDLLQCDTANRFIHQRCCPPEECSGCAYRTLCRTGCFRDWEQTPSGYHNYYCHSFQILLEYAVPYLQEIVDAEFCARYRL